VLVRPRRSEIFRILFTGQRAPKALTPRDALAIQTISDAAASWKTRAMNTYLAASEASTPRRVTRPRSSSATSKRGETKTALQHKDGALVTLSNDQIS